MATDIIERYTPAPLGANGTVALDGLSGILVATAGNITLTHGSRGVMLNAMPVQAGVYYPMPFELGSGGSVTATNGASGCIATGS